MTVLRTLERLLLPNACVACGRGVGERDPDALVCSACRWRLRPLIGGCPRCRQPQPPIGPCRFCAYWPPQLRWVRSAVWLGDEAREMVHHLKYQGYATLAQAMAEIIARFVATPPSGVLVPIPLSRGRERTRGYNQAAVLARALAGRWRLPVREDLLRRTREADSQTALTPEERLANVAGAFSATSAAGWRRGRGRAVGGAAGKSGEAAAVIIVDDVLTTGATLQAAAAALSAAGWSALGAVTFARALPFELRVS